ncbi:MAG: hypothetical protein WC222_07570 [Parachlamydiales bacterium]|jgi:hypothetical protein
MNKFLYVLCTFIFLCTAFHGLTADELHEEDQVSFKTYRRDYTFCRIFEFFAGAQQHGSVIKSSFHLRTHYDLYDKHGVFEAQAIYQLRPLSMLFTWAAVINIYDLDGNYLGQIDGQAMTTESAKFNIYNSSGERIAIAYLDENAMGFSVVSPSNSAFLLANLKRKFVKKMPDHWDVSVFEKELIPPLFVKIFSAFVCDRQGSFRVDN